jgi:predicted nuclease of predicted toxin-antitoxin system
VELEAVPNDIHEDDRLIVLHANQNDQTIVTRDTDFPNRRLCSISKGVLFIPQRTSGIVVKLEEVLPCLTRLLQSGRLGTLGHGVCTVLPTGIAFRLLSGEETYTLQEI